MSVFVQRNPTSMAISSPFKKVLALSLMAQPHEQTTRSESTKAGRLVAVLALRAICLEKCACCILKKEGARALKYLDPIGKRESLLTKFGINVVMSDEIDPGLDSSWARNKFKMLFFLNTNISVTSASCRLEL